MTSTEPISDESLIAYADGALEPEERVAVERRIQADPALADRARRFAESRARAKDALAPLLQEKVPDALSAAVGDMLRDADGGAESGEADVVSLASRRRDASAGMSRSSAPRARWAMPIAASVALLIGAAAGFMIGTSQVDAPDSLSIADLGQAGLVPALNTVTAGNESGIGADERFRAIATYRDGDGALCREFEVDRADGSTIVAVACRPDAAWQVQFAVVARQTSDGYAPASSLESLDAYLNATGAGAPLSPEAEEEALRALR